MTKKELAAFDGMQGEVEMVIPIHWVKVKGELLSAYYRDGQPACFTLPKINDCGMELRKASDLSRVMDGEAMLPKFNFKPSEETIAEIKRFSEKMNDPKFKELMKEAAKLREWTTDAALRDSEFLKDVEKEVLNAEINKELTQEELKKILDYDPKTGIFYYIGTQRTDKNGAVAGSVNKKGYLIISIHNKKYRAHRLAWLWYYGSFPTKQIDHIDHNKLNNAIENLREVDNQTNHMNMGLQKNNKSGHAGVFKEKESDRWVAFIKIKGKRRHIGCFGSYEEAVAARERAEYILGFHPNHGKDVGSYNVGSSDYSEHLLQPWQIILDWNLNYWDGDIIKRVLRTKVEPGMTFEQSRRLDMEKIIHICEERIRQIEEGVKPEVR